MTPDTQSTSSVAVLAAQETAGVQATVSEPRKLAGGAMHDSWQVDVTVDGITRALVVRVSPAGRADYDKTRREFEVLRVAFARGVHCPEPIRVGQYETGEDYLVMSLMPGDSNPRRLITDEGYASARRRLIEQLAADLALIHGILPSDVAHAGMIGPAEGEDPLAYGRWAAEEMYRRDLLNPHPAIEWAFRCRRSRLCTPEIGQQHGCERRLL